MNPMTREHAKRKLVAILSADDYTDLLWN